MAAISGNPVQDKLRDRSRRLLQRVRGWPRVLRFAVGGILVLGGAAGFLPVLGFWMLPLGLVVLSIDSPWLRHWRRRVELWWARRGR